MIVLWSWRVKNDKDYCIEDRTFANSAVTDNLPLWRHAAPLAEGKPVDSRWMPGGTETARATRGCGGVHLAGSTRQAAIPATYSRGCPSLAAPLGPHAPPGTPLPKDLTPVRGSGICIRSGEACCQDLYALRRA
jgi:hypothetical protein